jgi:hypothetical protein
VIDANEVLVDFLRRPRLEVMPLDGIEREVMDHVPSQRTVTVTSSPSRGIDATLSLCEQLAARGYHVVPHLAARLVVDRVPVRRVAGPCGPGHHSIAGHCGFGLTPLCRPGVDTRRGGRSRV